MDVKLVIDTTRFNVEVVDVVNSSNKTIQENITTFNTNLTTLANGTTWKGSSAVTNVGNLNEIYTAYVTAYTNFITALNTDCASIVARINEIITTNGGTGLSITSIDSLSFDNPKIEDLTFAGESGVPATIESCATAFKDAAAAIKTSYTSINNAFSLIGDDSSIFNTSAIADNPAKTIKNNVSSLIAEFSSIDEKKLNVCIENLITAANNIKGNN